MQADYRTYLELKELLPDANPEARARFRALFAHYYNLNTGGLTPEFKDRFFEILFAGNVIVNGRPNYAPILTELTHLFAAARLGHVIIIDDVRLFRERTGYPELSTVLALIEQDGGWDVLIQDDSLRLTPARPCPVACRSNR